MTTSTTGVEIGFAFSLANTSTISHYACCSPIRLGVTESMVSLGAWDGCADGREVAFLWPEEACVYVLPVV